jgi:KpsF/GutQ family protein
MSRVLATYRIETPIDPRRAAEAIAGEQSCGTFVRVPGETDELLHLIPHVKRAGAPVIAITGNEHSALAQAANIHLDARVSTEACPLGLAPTASTTAAQALGDALALALLDARGFSAQDFLRSHPAGTLGKRLVRVSEVMRSGDALPVVRATATLVDAIDEMSRKGMGMTVVTDGDGRVAGIFTDGDLRRCVSATRDVASTRVADVMTRAPRMVGPDVLAIDCVPDFTAPFPETLAQINFKAGLNLAVESRVVLRARAENTETQPQLLLEQPRLFERKHHFARE